MTQIGSGLFMLLGFNSGAQHASALIDSRHLSYNGIQTNCLLLQTHVVKGNIVCSDIWDKMCQILHESVEPQDFMKIMGLLPVPYLLHFISTGIDAYIGDNVAETVHPLQIEVNFVSDQV